MPQGGHPPHHSITSSARARTLAGISMPSALAVLRLITSSYLVGCWTGRSPGFSPLEDAVDVAGRVPVSGYLQRHLAHSWRPRRSAALYLLGCVLAAQDPRGDGGAGSHHSRQRQARPTMMRSCSPSPTASTSGGRMLASMSPSARVGTFASVRPWPGWSLRCFSRRSSGVILRLRWWRSSTSNTSAPPSAVPSA